MALVTAKKLLFDAKKEGRGVGAFNVGNMEMVIGAVKAAEEMKTPIIMQIAEKRLKHSPLSLMGPMMVNAAKEANVEIALNLDHAESMELIRKAIDIGFTAVMYDGSSLPLNENISKTLEVVRMAKATGASVEAEIGQVGGAEGGEAHEMITTDPEEARMFALKTGVDCLAVAIGNAHGNYSAPPDLRFDVLTEIAELTDPLPLVLHGGSGISDEDFRRAIRCGIVKVNIATASFNALTSYASDYLKSDGERTYFGLNEAMIKGVYENVKRHIALFGESALDTVF